MKINLRELEYFVAIAEQRHFGKASQLVNVTQPTLSMQFRKLEQRLGGKLIERLPRDAILTAFGTEVLPLAREIVRLAHEIETRSGSKKLQSRVRLGVLPTIAPYLLPKINRALGRGIGGKKISLTEGQTSDLVSRVKSGAIDAAILSTPLNESGIEELDVFAEPFYVAVNRAHPLATRKKLSLADLQQEKLLLLGEGHCLRNQALSICNVAQSSEDADLSATSIETLRSMVAMGAGVTLVPKLAVRKGENISYIPISETAARRTIGIVYRPSFSEMPLIELLADIIRVAAQKEGMSVSDRRTERN